MTSDRSERTGGRRVGQRSCHRRIHPAASATMDRGAGRRQAREAADALRGQVIRAEAIDDPGALWVHDLVGAVVVTPDGRSGDLLACCPTRPTISSSWPTAP